MSTPRIDDRDWSGLTLGERIRNIEVEGYVVLPNLLSEAQIAQLKAEIEPLETTPADYSVHQRARWDLQFEGGALAELIAHPPTIAFLKELFGQEVVFMTYAYTISEPGHPGISLHTDGQPYGHGIFGYDGSCPFQVRVLYYLDDLSLDVSPFRVVPYSHLSMHADANPYNRYTAHPEEVLVPAKAGSAILINYKVFHGNFPNVGSYARRMLALAYRPAWAGPVVKDLPAWRDEDLARLPASVRPFFVDRNIRQGDFYGGHKPANMASEAPGINPSRWARL